METDSKELELELTKLQIKALKMIPHSPRQMKVRKDIDRVRTELENLRKVGRFD